MASATASERTLRRLGLRGRMPKATFSSRGAWRLAGIGSVQTALCNYVLHGYGFLMPSNLAAMQWLPGSAAVYQKPDVRWCEVRNRGGG